MSENFSFGGFVWWVGVVEDINDPEKLGRVRVRVHGYHTKSLGELQTGQLMWATVVHPTTSAAVSGLGTSPTGLLPSTNVIGFFMDGEDAQVPVVFGAIGGKPESKATNEGFNDPSGTFPRYTKESDVNRLARAEKLDETVQEKKKELDSAQGFQGQAWEEPASPYAAVYPNNHVRETVSGHIEEFDDTPGAERIHRYHKAGTFEEIHPDGSKVIKIVKDNYTIVMGDDYVHVLGDASVHINGNSNVRVNGNCNLQVDGDKTEIVAGNSTLRVGGNYTVDIGGSHSDNAGGRRTINAPRVDIN